MRQARVGGNGNRSSAPEGRTALGAVRRSFAPWADPAAVPLIRIEGVTRRFGSLAALDNLSLAIYPREFFALLGPSGCGKSTLLRMLAGFERPDEGRILLDGVDITDTPPHRRPVNMMFQSYALFPHLTVAGNVAFGLKQEGMGRAALAARVEEMLALVQLTALADRRPHQLSGGQRQRVALARALARRPRVLLLDEPLGALDKKLREDTQFELMDLQQDLGATFVVVTHDQEEAMVMSDRMAVMNAGRILQVGTPAEIYEQPATRAVAEFVGEINLFDGVSRGGSQVECPDFAAPLEVPEPGQPGRPVSVAVRPEKLRIGRPGTLDSRNTARGLVWDIGYLGDWTVFFVKLGTGTVVRVTRANAERQVAEPLTWDEAVDVGFGPDDAVVLPA